MIGIIFSLMFSMIAVLVLLMEDYRSKEEHADTFFKFWGKTLVLVVILTLMIIGVSNIIRVIQDYFSA